ncbi:hypothetical protein HA402_012501 [Bradysia odoriphaga]|nr:hypothetical protein HA402_012501 [Bradysia odoriphaga]
MFSTYTLTTNILRGVQQYSRLGLRNIGSIRNSVTSCNRNLFIKSQPKTNQNSILHRFCSNGPKAEPVKSKKIVGYWLLGCSGMVFTAVVLGGVTRLTESGLSMVNWKLLGERWPKTEDEWIAEFEKYKQYPEFKLKNPDISLSDFKSIFFMEYAHRMWGRLIGGVFAIPAIYFWSRGYLSKQLKPRILIYGTLIGIQGLMGWYMVKSGLENRFNEPNDVPRVSQYRLATHLSLAFILYVSMFWAALDNLIPAQKLATAATKGALRFRQLAMVAKTLIFCTAVSGAFVAGLDAGLIYNSFPKMADKWIPSDIMALSPIPRNFTENPTTVQFDHRILGISTLSVVTAVWFMARKHKLPPRAYYAATALGMMGWLQVALGISTLLTHVPVALAACHQSGSLVLLSAAFWLTHELKYLKYLPK